MRKISELSLGPHDTYQVYFLVPRDLSTSTACILSLFVDVYWRWAEDKKSCKGYTDKGYKKTIKQCADSCFGATSAFVYGTNDFGRSKCESRGCPCYCITGAQEDGSCSAYTNNVGYRYFKFGSYGKS